MLRNHLSHLIQRQLPLYNRHLFQNMQGCVVNYLQNYVAMHAFLQLVCTYAQVVRRMKITKNFSTLHSDLLQPAHFLNTITSQNALQTLFRSFFFNILRQVLYYFSN